MPDINNKIGIIIGDKTQNQFQSMTWHNFNIIKIVVIGNIGIDIDMLFFIITSPQG